MIADAWYHVAFSTNAECKDFFGTSIKRTVRDRLLALQELRDTAVGRPRQTLDVDVPTVPLFALPAGMEVDIDPRVKPEP